MTAVTEIRLPQFGMGMQEGTIITWFKREGDPVAAGDVVAEIEAEKVTEELVATGGGVLQRILVPEGDTAAVNELLAVIVAVGAVGPDVADGADAAKDEPDAAEGPRTAAVDSGPGSSPGQALRRNDERGGGSRPATAPAVAGDGPQRQVTPRARRLAADLGIDIDSVVGTGPGGRVTENDVAATAGGDR